MLDPCRISDFNEWEYDAKNNRLSDKEFTNNMSPAHDMSKISGHNDKDHRADIDKTGFKHTIKDKPDVASHVQNVDKGSAEGLQLKEKNVRQDLNSSDDVDNSTYL